MKLRTVLTMTAACIALATPMYAATVTLNVSGTTTGAEGTINYTPGSAFSATAVFDDSFADTNADPNVGTFFDFGAATTALVSFALNTEFGLINYDPSAVTAPLGTFLTAQVAQASSPIPESQRLNVVSGGDPLGEAFSGSIGALEANFLGLSIGAQGPDSYLYDDPNSLFSGFESGFSNAPLAFGGSITTAQFGGFDTTTLFFGAVEFSITGGDGSTPPDGSTDPISPVPLPASLPLMAFGLFGLGFVAKRKQNRA
ncbi:MAG: PEP-CTERM sorting domain-containing protein [Roseobacter sp.]